MKVFHWRISWIDLLITILFVLATSTACDSPAKSYYYTVNVINQGGEQIVVDPFRLYDGAGGTMEVGMLDPGIEAGMGAFNQRPNVSHTIRWKGTRSGKQSEATIKLELPTEFTKKNGSDIYFYIDSEKQSVRVAYRVFDAKGNLKFFE